MPLNNNTKRINNCRISSSNNLIEILSLGTQTLTGVFPKNKTDDITKGPLDLVWCPDSGLVQLGHSYDLNEMYGANYGYRSGLNSSMVSHLHDKTKYLENLVSFNKGDIVLDIGSNDGTLLKSYSDQNISRVGIDPTGTKFKEFYKEGIQLIPDFFSAETFQSKFNKKRAKIISSISMFYDLENPCEFVSDIRKILHENGIWHFEQSYMPSMLRTNAYDTICHEHLEYYSLKVVKNLLESQGLKIIDVRMNNINGGSFAVTASHISTTMKSNEPMIDWMLDQEERMGLDSLKPYQDFKKRVFNHRDDLKSLIKSLAADGNKIAGYGASTKGNVLLQFCDFTTDDIQCIAEVNSDKFGSFTPGTMIPIHSEQEVHLTNPDFLLVLPWHFRDNILKREKEFLNNGGKLIFPLPEIEIYQ